MTNLTVEQITALITEAVNSEHASKLLRKLGVQVVQLSTRPKKYTVSTSNAQVYFFNEQQSGDLSLTVYRDASLAPQQEPAVQVPATAPAAGHLSTKSVNN